MIRLYSFYNGVVTDITNVIESINNTGDKAQAARKLDVTLAYPILGKEPAANTDITGYKSLVIARRSRNIPGVGMGQGNRFSHQPADLYCL